MLALAAVKIAQSAQENIIASKTGRDLNKGILVLWSFFSGV